MDIAGVLALFDQHAEGIKSFGVATSAIVAAATFVWKTRAEQRARERQIYNDLDEKYFVINQLILYHPRLDVSWYRDIPDVPRTGDELHQQDILFEMITRLFERAFLIFRDAGSDHHRRQWQGWHDFIEDYCRKRSYRDWWQRTDWPLRQFQAGDSSQFDVEFEAYMAQMLAQTQPVSPRP